MTMKYVNNPLRNTLETIRISLMDGLYNIFSAQTNGLNDKVGLIEYALTKFKDMTLACQLRKIRINRIK